jgi:hypothetical protein
VMSWRTFISCQSLDMDRPHRMHSKKLALIVEVMTIWAALPTDFARANTHPKEFRNI